MYGGIRYGGEEDLDLSQNLNIVPGTDYALSFVYRGSFPQNLNVYICYSSGWCTQAQGYPVIYLDNVPLGDYLSWQYYSDSFTYAISFSTACGGSSCFREMILGKFNYGDTQIQGDNFYVDDVQLEEGSVAGPFAGDGSDILKYAADVTTLNLNVGTAEAWVYVDDNIRETSQNRYIFAHKGYLTFGYSNRLSLGHMTSNEWSYAITDSTGASESVTVPDTLSEGWHHFAVTWDKNTEGGYIEMFIDGASVGKKTNIASNFPDNYEDGIYVGSWSSGYGWTNTQIDDFRISDYVRY
jgi:hypothetical protein